MAEEELEENDLLPKMKNKMFLVSELAPLFGTKDDELANILKTINDRPQFVLIEDDEEVKLAS